MIIKLLKILNKQQYRLTDIAKILDISVFSLLELIGNINRHQKLIVNNYKNEYYLLETLDFLDGQKIIDELATHAIDDYSLVVIDQVASTNSHVLANLNQYSNKTLVTTEYQNDGRGRSSKRWVSKIASDFTLSYYYRLDNINLNALPLLVAVSLAECFKLSNVDCLIKWPNDIYYNQNKIAGILVESRTISNTAHVVIGVGINNINHFARNEFIVNFTQILDSYITTYQLFGFPSFVEAWNSLCFHLNHPVMVSYEDIKISGTVIGVDNNGSLLIKLGNGDVIAHHDTRYSLIMEK